MRPQLSVRQLAPSRCARPLRYRSLAITSRTEALLVSCSLRLDLARSPTRPNSSARRSTTPSRPTAWTGSWDRDDYLAMLEESGGQDRVAAYASSVGQDVDAEAIHRTKSERFQQPASPSAGVEPREGVVETVEEAKRSGAKVALVTTTAPENISSLLDALEPALQATDFDLVVDSSSVDEPKPDPAAYRFALDRLGEQAEDCVAIEDNVGGVRGGGRRGAALLRLREPEHRRPRLRRRRSPHRPRRLRAARRQPVARRGATTASACATAAAWPYSAHPTMDEFMSHVQARVRATERAFHVEGYEKIEYSLLYADGAFSPESLQIADSYRRFGRCLMVVDEAIYGLYGEQIESYFDAPRARPDGVRRRDQGDRQDAADGRAHRRRLRRLRARARRAGARRRRRPDHRRRRPRLRDLPPPHHLHPRADDAHRADRRERRDQGRRQPRRHEEPARRLPRLREGDPRLLLPGDAAGRAGAQRDGGADQDRRRRRPGDLRAARALRRRAASGPASVTSTAATTCARLATASPTTRSARCSTWKCRTCTSSTSTG